MIPARAPDEPQPPGERRTLIALTIGFIALFYAPALFGQQFYRRDTWRLLLGCRVFLGEELRQGRFPGWFPYDALGAPLHSQAVCSLLHPLSWLAALLRPELVLNVQILSAIALAAAGAWSLARVLGASPSGCAVAALSYALSGYLTSETANLVYLWGAAALPLTLACFAGAALDRWTRGRIALAALTVASVVWMGDLQGAVLFTAMAGLAGLGLASGRGGWRRYLAGAAATGVLLLGLAAPQLLPSWFLFHESVRGAGIGWEDATYWSLHPLRLPELFLSGMSPAHAVGRATTLFGSVPGYLLWAEALGGSAVVSALALGALASRQLSPRIRAVLGATALLGVLLALGRFGGAYAVLYRLSSVVRGFRFPEKITPVFLMAWSALGALGWTVAGPTWRRALAFGALALGLGALASVLGAGQAAPVWGSYLRDLAFALGTGAAGVGLVALLLSASPRVRNLALVALVAGDVARSSLDAYDLQPLDASALTPETVSILHGLGVSLGHARITLAGFPPIPQDERGVLSDDERVAAQVDRAKLMGATGARYGIEMAELYLQGYPAKLAEAIGSGPVWLRDLAPRFNVAAVLVPNRLAKRYGDVGASPWRETEAGVAVLRLPSAWPRAFLAGADALPSGEASLSQVAALAPGRVLVDGWAVAADPPVSGSASVAEYTPDRVALDVAADGAGFVVLDDLYSGGWSATVDGQAVPVYRANALVRAVRVTPGRHRVVFEYRVPGLRAGLLFLLAVLVLAAVAGALWPRLARPRG